MNLVKIKYFAQGDNVFNSSFKSAEEKEERINTGFISSISDLKTRNFSGEEYRYAIIRMNNKDTFCMKEKAYKDFLNAIGQGKRTLL